MIGYSSDNYSFDKHGKEFFSENFMKKLKALNDCVFAFEEPLEGNIFYRDRQPNYVDREPDELFSMKRRNIARIALSIDHVVEVGVNAGHSALFWLSLNPKLSYLGIDIGRHGYTNAAIEHLKLIYPGRVDYIKGDSRDVIPTLGQTREISPFNLIHIDGGHGENVCKSDILNSITVCKKANCQFLLIDDTNMPVVRNVLNYILFRGLLSEETMFGTFEGDMQVLARVL